jgi:hypothetical protein
MIVVLATVFLMGGGTIAMLKALQIEYGCAESTSEDDFEDSNSSIRSTAESDTTGGGAMLKHLRWLDQTVLVPLLTSHHVNASIPQGEMRLSDSDNGYEAPFLSDQPDLDSRLDGETTGGEEAELLGC